MEEMTPGQRSTAAARGARRRKYEERIAEVLRRRGWKCESPYDSPENPPSPLEDPAYYKEEQQ
jgi:hypothetical protein